MMTRQARPSAKIIGFDTHMILEAVPARHSNTGTAIRPSTGHHATMPGPCPAGVSRDEFFLDELVEFVQVDVTEHGRYHAALRNPAQRVMVLPVFQVPGLEHVTDQPEKPVIADLLRQYPQKDIVAETAEAVGDVSLDKPHGPGPGPLYFPQRGMTAPPFPETMRPARKQRLVIRLQQEPHHLAGE